MNQTCKHNKQKIIDEYFDALFEKHKKYKIKNVIVYTSKEGIDYIIPIRFLKTTNK